LGGTSLSELLAGTAVSAYFKMEKRILDFLIGMAKPNYFFFEGIKI
jgi:hypothetical protein